MRIVVDARTGMRVEIFDSKELEVDLTKFNADVCAHPRQDVRCMTVRGGSKQIKVVCLDCGEPLSQPLKRKDYESEPPAFDREGVAGEFIRRKDEELQKIYQRHIILQERRDASFQKEYDAYMRSDAWKHARKKVMKRANNICEACLERPATQVHHLSYQHFMREFMFELVAICHDCHERWHKTGSAAELDTERMPCLGCRWLDWGESTPPQCFKLSMPVAQALAQGGPCGPQALALEPLK